MTDKNWWLENRGSFKWVLSLLIAVMAGGITYKLQSMWYIPFLSAAACAIAVFVLTNICEFNCLYPKMRDHILLILGPLKGLASLIDEAHRLDSGKRDLSVAFANCSLQRLPEVGFVKTDVPFDEFLKHIKNLSKHTASRIFGTSSVRRPLELAENESFKDYLKVLIEHPNRRLIRVTILSQKDVQDIVEYALGYLRQGSGSPAAPPIYDFPEIQWWSSWASQVDYADIMTPDIQPGAKRILLWTWHDTARTKTSMNHLDKATDDSDEIDDYAIFDDVVGVKFWEDQTRKRTMLFTYWGANKLDKLKESIPCIDRALAGTIHKRQLVNLGYYVSFYDLLKNISSVEPIDVSKYSICSPHFQSQKVPPHAVYSKIMELVNNGNAEFDSEYMNKFS